MVRPEWGEGEALPGSPGSKSKGQGWGGAGRVTGSRLARTALLVSLAQGCLLDMIVLGPRATFGAKRRLEAHSAVD